MLVRCIDINKSASVYNTFGRGLTTVLRPRHQLCHKLNASVIRRKQDCKSDSVGITCIRNGVKFWEGYNDGAQSWASEFPDVKKIQMTA